MIDTVTNAIDDSLEELSEWFLGYIFSDESINTGGSAFKYIFDKIFENVFSFKCILLVFGVMFLCTIIRFLVSLIRG